MATKGSGGGGFGSRPHVKKPVKTGASARRDVPAGVNQIGAAQGNHVTEQGSTRYSGVKRDVGVLPGVGSVPLGNEVALNVGKGGPGKGRDPVMRAGSQGTYGAVNPGSSMTPSSGDLTKLDWKR